MGSLLLAWTENDIVDLCKHWPRCWVMPNGTTLSWWRRQMETFSALLALCAGNSLVTGEFSAQRPVTRSFDVSFDVRLNKRLSKQSWGWWFETSSRSLWRQCNDHRSQYWLIIRETQELISTSQDHIDGLVRERRNSSALAVALRSCTNPSISNGLLQEKRNSSALAM